MERMSLFFFPFLSFTYSMYIVYLISSLLISFVVYSINIIIRNPKNIYINIQKIIVILFKIHYYSYK